MRSRKGTDYPGPSKSQVIKEFGLYHKGFWKVTEEIKV